MQRILVATTVVSCALGLGSAVLGQQLPALRDQTAVAPQTAVSAAPTVPDGLNAADWASLRRAYATARRQTGASGSGHGANASLMIAPVAQQAYLKASNAEQGDGFSGAVAVSGNTVVVGASFEDSDATGINGSQGNEPLYFAESGAAYVFVRDGASWAQQAYLKASNTGFFDGFGYTVAISGDTIVVGSIRENSSATGINGNQVDDSLGFAGAVYVFVRNGSTWSQQAYIKASNTEANDQFAFSLAVDDDTIVVGANLEDSLATGVDGNEFNNAAPGAGAVYVFLRTGSQWRQEAYLKPSNTGSGDMFGSSVSLSGNTVIVGATGEDSRSTGVGGNESNDNAPNSGAAYVFVRSGTTWSQQAYLKASNTQQGDRFAISVAASGETVVVGADFEDSNATGIDGNQMNNQANASGAAYVFGRNGSAWSQQAYLKASNSQGGDWFGGSVALSGNLLAVGALNESSGATGINGDEGSDAEFQSGAVYLFDRVGNVWGQRAYVKASNTEAFDAFGRTLSLSSDTLIVGTPGDDSGSIGINGDPFNNSAFTAGSLFVFDVPTETWVSLGGGTAGSAGTPNLVGTGDLVGGSPTTLDLTSAPAGAAMLGWVSFAPVPFPAVGGVVHAFPHAAQFFFLADGSGEFSVTTAWPLGLLPMTQVWFQFIVQDRTTAPGVTLSNGLLATTP